VPEENLLEYLGKDASTKKHLHFILVVGNDFNKIKEEISGHTVGGCSGELRANLRNN
jgi:hypothetical protein